MRKKNRRPSFFYLQKMSQGVVLSIVIIAIYFAYDRKITMGDIFLHETLPHYPLNFNTTFFKFEADSENDREGEKFSFEEVSSVSTIEPVAEPVFRVVKVEDMDGMENIHDVIGLDEVIFQPETDSEQTENHLHKEALTVENIDMLRDINYLRDNFYIVDRQTAITADDFNVDNFLNTDLKIDNESDGPKILIFHTHSNEMYSNSDPSNSLDGVMGAGEVLARVLNDKYGIETLHHMGRYDVEDGKSKVLGAYERMEPEIRKILADHPSIQVLIDLHRDGVPETTHLVTHIDGKPTAKLMFFNGLSKLMKDGELVPISGLPNPYLQDNLAMSFVMQLTANKLHPSFTRKVYLNAYRYSNHMLPKSMLIEVGAQTNTKEEAFNAMEPLAEILANVIS